MYYFTESEETSQVSVWFWATPRPQGSTPDFIAWTDGPQAAQKLIDRLRQADRLDNAYGEVLWKEHDVMDKFGVSREEAAEYLREISWRLKGAQTEKGWEIIHLWAHELKDGRTPGERAAWQQLQGECEQEQEQAEEARNENG